jgi:hypothetical protein
MREGVIVEAKRLHRAYEDAALLAAVEVLGEHADLRLDELPVDERLEPPFGGTRHGHGI